ncbi:hypothetical protein [Actinacidiphila alni]|uniref:hypothetical protein n=1 Tax=Actinacidiphila alni TaxID=380248 RepID=UPI003454E9BD
MSRDISVSAEYIWPSSTGLHDWVVERLRERVPDPAVWAYADRAGFEVLHDFRVHDLPEPGRHAVLAVLAEEIPQAYGAWARERSSLSEGQIMGLVHDLEILAMMAVEVRRELDEGDGDEGGGA